MYVKYVKSDIKNTPILTYNMDRLRRIVKE